MEGLLPLHPSKVFVCCVPVPWEPEDFMECLPYTGRGQGVNSGSGLVWTAFTCQATSVAETSPVYTCGPTPGHVCLNWKQFPFFFYLVVGKEYRQTTVEIHFSFDFWFSILKMSKSQVLSAQVLKFLGNDLPYWWFFFFRKYGRTAGRGHLTTVWKQILRPNWQNIGNWHWCHDFAAGYLNLCHR